ETARRVRAVRRQPGAAFTHPPEPGPASRRMLCPSCGCRSVHLHAPDRGGRVDARRAACGYLGRSSQSCSGGSIKGVSPESPAGNRTRGMSRGMSRGMDVMNGSPPEEWVVTTSGGLITKIEAIDSATQQRTDVSAHAGLSPSNDAGQTEESVV